MLIDFYNIKLIYRMNILSYFIKDKSQYEHNNYKSSNSTDIMIEYKDKLIYQIILPKNFNLQCNINFLTNTIKYYVNNNIHSITTLKKSRRHNVNDIYYKQNTSIFYPNEYVISYIILKYQKLDLEYKLGKNKQLYFYLVYYNNLKYKKLADSKTNKYSQIVICIPNKYELYYYSYLFQII